MKPRLTLTLAAIAATLVITISCHKKTRDTNTEEFANFTMNGVSYNYAPPADSVILYKFREPYILKALRKGGDDPYDTYVKFNASGTGISTIEFSLLRVNHKSWLMQNINTTPIHITEFGDIGSGYVAGTFTAIMKDTSTNQLAEMNCTFRARRSE